MGIVSMTATSSNNALKLGFDIDIQVNENLVVTQSSGSNA